MFEARAHAGKTDTLCGDARLTHRVAFQRPEIISGVLSPEQVEAYTSQASVCGRILRIFRDGALLLDEVDLILHPLKSELNWPLGAKEPLDFTAPPRNLEVRLLLSSFPPAL